MPSATAPASQRAPSNAVDLDSQRRDEVAYEYLCRLEEARCWMEHVLCESLPAGVDLEESLRHGVYLARLARALAPEHTVGCRIFDGNLERYTAAGLHFRHTDNINMWARAVLALGLPVSIVPTTSDVYERKNAPKTIYCLHALSMLSFRLGRCEQMDALFGRVQFAADQLASVATELRKQAETGGSGCLLPAFHQIGGVLTPAAPKTDASAMADAASAVNASLDELNDNEDASYDRLISCLRAPCLGLTDVHSENASFYCRRLVQALTNKRSAVVAVHSGDRGDGCRMMTQPEFQGHVTAANSEAALHAVSRAVINDDQTALIQALSRLKLPHVKSQQAARYLHHLARVVHVSHTDTQGRGDGEAASEQLSREQVELLVERGNSEAELEQRREAALLGVNRCISGGGRGDNVDQLLEHLCCLGLRRNALVDWAGRLFLAEMTSVRAECGRDLDLDAVGGAICLLPAVAAINAAVHADDAAALATALSCRHAFLLDVDEMAVTRYLSALQRRLTSQSLSSATAESVADNFLTHQQLQETIDDVNRRAEDERRIVALLGDINDAVRHGDVDALQKSLTDNLLQLPASVTARRSTVVHCLQLMRACGENKRSCQDARHDDDDDDEEGEVWLDDLADCVAVCERHSGQACAALAALATINTHLSTITAHQLITLLRDEGMALLRVQHTAAERYLTALRRHARQHNGGGRGGRDCMWARHVLPDGYEVYLQLDVGCVSWEPPVRRDQDTTYGGDRRRPLIDSVQLQAVIDSVNNEMMQQRPQQKEHGWLVALQAAARGCLVRRRVAAWRRHWMRHVYQVVLVQAWWRGVLQRRRFLPLLAEKRQREVAALRHQVAALRERQTWEAAVLQRYEPLQRYILMVQRWWRHCRARLDLTQLASSARPTVSEVRRFVHLLDASGSDFREEILLQKLKASVAQAIRKNQQLERDLDALDVKIGLLVKNRISLQEVLLHSRSVDRLAGSGGTETGSCATLSRQEPGCSGAGLKALTKQSRRRLQLYQELFYVLQTQPGYLARLVFALPAGQAGRCLDSIVFSVFGYGAHEREEYLLLRLFRAALETEVSRRLERPADLTTGGGQVVRLLVEYCRRHSLRPLLEPLVTPLVNADRRLQINTSPTDVYRLWINEQESCSGQPCGLPYHVSAEQALEHEEVRVRISSAVDVLKKESSRFMERIFSSIDQLPYCLLYMAKVLRRALHDKFPSVADKDVLKVVGHLVYYRFINSAIIAPDAFGVIDMPAGQALTSDQRRNLGSVAKILQFVASKKGFGVEASHLCSLNAFIVAAHERFKHFLLQCCSVAEPDQHFSRHEFSEATQMARPVIFITPHEISQLHEQLITHRHTVIDESSEHADMLGEILDELGEPVPPPPPADAAGTTDASALSQDRAEMCLTLTARPTPADDGRLSLDKTFVQCKQLLVDVIQCTADADVATCARREPTAGEERAFRQLQQRRGSVEQRRQGSELLRRCDSACGGGGPACVTLEETKDALLERLRLLERAGRVSREDDYGTLLTAVVADVCHQRRYRQQRRRQLTRLRATLVSLAKKTTFYQEQAAYYSQYVGQCLRSMEGAATVTTSAGSVSVRRRTAPVRYTAARLRDKGVLLAIDGVRGSEMRRVQLEIAPHSHEHGVFVVTGRMLGVSLDQVTVRLSDLLQLQYDGVAVINMFGRAKINVNLLLFLINKKFYGKQAK